MIPPLISIQNVSKNYGKVQALHPFSLTIEKTATNVGKIWGLIGPNGAGKTTLIKILLDLLPPTTGSITIAGVPHTESEARSYLTYLPEKFCFYPYYTVKQALVFFGGLRGLSGGAELEKLINNAIDLLELRELQYRKISTLSKGQLQRVGLAQLLIHSPQSYLIILDEPFSGLDPIGIRDLKQLLRKLKEQGKTIFISSHLLSEVEQIVEEVCVLHKGRLLKRFEVGSIPKGSSLENYFCSIIEGTEGGK